MNSAGINPLKPLFPPVIDAAFMPGVNYARTPQIRFVKTFDDKKGAFGLSFESPQAVTGGLCSSGTASSANNPSVSTADTCVGFNTQIRLTSSAFTANMNGNLTTDTAPDILAKVAYDPGFGHFELLGVTRFFRDTVINTGKHNYAVGTGIGAGAFIPVIPKALDFHANVMVGQGIGRYGVVQLPDYAITSATGKLKPLREYTALFGVIGHPTSALDTYLYAGWEQAFRQDEGLNTNAYGYGNSGASNANCNVINGTTNCMAQTSSVWQITPGVWYRVYDGAYGKMQIGLQHSWTRRNTFSDNAGRDPHSINNMTLFSVRFFPF